MNWSFKAGSIWVQRAWQEGAGRWWLAGLLGSAGLALMSWSGLQAMQQAELRQALFDRLALMGEPAARTPERGFAAARADFVARLPAAFDDTELLRELTRLQLDHGVRVEMLGLRQRSASPELLGRAEVNLTVAGSYASTVLLLKALLERYPSASLQRLQIRRSQASQDLESSVVLVFWTRAAAIGAALSPPLPKPAP
jgi:hypothetical protein